MKKNLKRMLALSVVLAMLLSTSVLAAEYWFGEDSSSAATDTFENSVDAVNSYDGEETSATIRMDEDVTVDSSVEIGNSRLDSITIDGGGHTIEAASSEEGEGGSAAFNDTAGGVVATHGNVTLNDVTVDANGEARGVAVKDGTLTLAGDTTITDGATHGTSDVNRCGGGAFINNGATLVMNDESTITGNTAASNVMSDGGGVSNKGTLVMNDNASITGNTANRYGGGVDNWGGTVEMNDNATISGNHVTNPSDTSNGHSSSSGGILNGGGTVTMNDNASISGNDSADRCGGVQNRGTFVMNDSSTISDNTSGGQCAGVYNYNGNGTTGTFTMNDDSSVKNNTSNSQIGGVSNYSEMTMNGNAQISGNSAANGIGGAINFADSSITMNDNAQISGNSGGSAHTGGLYNYGSVTMNDNAQISNNTAGTNSGGVLNVSGGTLTMNDNASVSNNASGSSQAGGIYNAGAVVMNDSSSIAGNTAGTHAGGIYNYSTGTLTMNGSSTISGNTAARQGGGIYNNAAMVEMNDSASVTGNTAATGIGGVANTGTFTMNAGTSITNNSSGAHTGGIYTNGTLTINGATISGNTATDAAAINIKGASAEKPANTYLNNVRIENNTSTAEGGADIQVKNGTLTISDGWYDVSLNDTGTDTSIQITKGVFRLDPDTYSVLAAHHHDDGFYYVTDQDCVYTYESHAATCTTDGYTTYTCACGYTYTETIPAAGHAYDAVVTAPTCTAGGYTTYTCAHCGDSYTADSVPAAGHTAGDPVISSQAANYGVDGYTDTDVYCIDCGVLLSHEHSVIPALVRARSSSGSDRDRDSDREPDPVVTIDNEDVPLAGAPSTVTIENEALPLAAQPGAFFTLSQGLATMTASIASMESGAEISAEGSAEEFAAGIAEGSNAKSDTPAPSAEAVALLSEIINTTGVNADGIVTREEFVYAMYTIAQSRGYDTSASIDLSGFTDLDHVSEYALAAVQWAVENKLLKGISVDLLAPEFNLTYEQMLLFLERFAAYDA